MLGTRVDLQLLELLSGEAGIGKSRVTASLMERLVSEPHTRLRYFCSPQHTDSAHYPVIGQMERAAGFVYDDSPQTKLDKFDAVLADTSTRMEDAALFAEMLSLPNDGRYPALDLEPQQRRQKTLEALTAQVEALSRQNPLLMIFEDAHWTDPTSLETLGRVVDRVRSLPVLLIVTFRPEFEPAWIGCALYRGSNGSLQTGFGRQRRLAILFLGRDHEIARERTIGNQLAVDVARQIGLPHTAAVGVDASGNVFKSQIGKAHAGGRDGQRHGKAKHDLGTESKGREFERRQTGTFW